MNASDRGYKIFQELDSDAMLVALRGFDSDLVAVATNSGITLIQSYSDEGDPQEIFLHEECYEQLIKLLKERL